MKIEHNPNFVTINDSFPNIGNKIKVFWGYPEFVALMLELQQDTSLRPRMGFPSNVLMALQHLEAEHDLVFPQLRREIPSFWQSL